MTSRLLQASTIAVLLVCAIHNADAQSTSAPTGVATPAAACPAGVLTFVPIAAASSSGTTYAVAFQTFTSSPGHLSGTVTMFAGNDRYDIPFSNAIAVPALESEALKATPIVVRFPSGTTIDAAYLSAINGPNPGPCGVGNVERRGPRLPRSKDLMDLDHAIAERARSMSAIDAPKAAVDVLPCDKPSTDASATFSATPAYPDFAGKRGDSGVVLVDVALSAEGTLLGAWVWKSSGFPALDAAALAAAHASRYDAGTFRCHAAFAIYRFYADFEHQ